jgi:hypothetical protein
MMADCADDVRKVARLSGKNRTDVYKHLKRFGVPLNKNKSYGHKGNWGDLSDQEPISSEFPIVNFQWGPPPTP